MDSAMGYHLNLVAKFEDEVEWIWHQKL